MPTLTRRQFLIAATVAPALVAALPAQAATHEVQIAGMAFVPATLTIAVGDTVRFTNTDGAPHTATFTRGGLTTRRLGRGQSDELTFARAGSFDYVCEVHPHMTGRIVVR